MPTPLPVLRVDVAHIDEACIIRPEGELDLAGCPSLELALEDAEENEAERLILDLEDLEFIDARGLRVLLEAAQRSARNGNRLQVTRGRGQVARMLDFAEFGKLLPLTDACMCPAIQAPAAGRTSVRKERITLTAGHRGRATSPGGHGEAPENSNQTVVLPA